MTSLVIKTPEIIDNNQIILIEDNQFFKIKYQIKPNVYMTNLFFKINNIGLQFNKGFYYLSIKDKIINDKIISLDDYFKTKISYYKTFIRNNKVLFYKNYHLDNYFKNYKENIKENKQNDIYLIIKYIKKGKDNYPIIHIKNEL